MDLNTILPIFLSSLCSFLIALLLFVVKERKEKEKKNEKENRRMIEIEEYFLYFMKYLKNIIDEQINNFEEMLDQLRNETTRTFEIYFHPGFDFVEKSFEVDSINLFKILVTQRNSSKETKINHFFWIKNSIGTLPYLKETALKAHGSFMTEYKKRIELLNQNINELNKLFRTYSEKNNESLENVYNDLSDLKIMWDAKVSGKMENMTPQNVYNHLLSPLDVFLKKHSNTKISLEFYPFVSKSFQLFNEITFLKNSQIKFLEGYIKEIGKLKTNTLNALVFYEKNPLMPISFK